MEHFSLGTFANPDVALVKIFCCALGKSILPCYLNVLFTIILDWQHLEAFCRRLCSRHSLFSMRVCGLSVRLVLYVCSTAAFLYVKGRKGEHGCDSVLPSYEQLWLLKPTYSSVWGRIQNNSSGNNLWLAEAILSACSVVLSCPSMSPAWLKYSLEFGGTSATQCRPMVIGWWSFNE